MRLEAKNSLVEGTPVKERKDSSQIQQISRKVQQKESALFEIRLNLEIGMYLMLSKY